MKVTVVVLVYNRYNNLRHWLECWTMCDKTSAELIVVHNTDNFADTSYVDLCVSYKIPIIERKNVGFDIGALQEVCNDTLEGFPKWERLLWVTDDTFPMSLNFVQRFNVKMNPTIGVVCMQISLAVRPHIRTTGFMIDKRLASKIRFIANPVLTKNDCYQFEHRHSRLTFYDQVKRMGFRIVQVAPNEVSPLWDSGYHRRLKRGYQHRNLFGEFNTSPVIQSEVILPKHNEQRVHSVTFICTIYKGYPQIISSLLQQTNPNWELWLIHDGPGNVADVPNDERIKMIYTDQRRGNWGHSYRQEYLQKVTTEYIVITNNDNYHVPVYIEYMLLGFRPDTVGVYCSDMVHSYTYWGIIPCSLSRGYVDCAGMMLRTACAKKVGWNNTTDHSADWIFFDELIKEYGADKFNKVAGCLLVHN